MIDIDLLKTHLKFDCDETTGEEEPYLVHLIDSAIEAFNTYTNRTLIASDDELPTPVGNTIKMTKSIEQGALLLIGHWYLNRETVLIGVAGSALPMGTESLWKPHRWNNI